MLADLTKMDVDLYWYRAAPVRVVDGDTLIIEIDLGMRTRIEISCRVAGVDTPEIFTGSDRERGLRAAADTAAWLTRAKTDDRSPRWPLLVRTYKDSKSFDRYVADVYLAATGESLAVALKAAGW